MQSAIDQGDTKVADIIITNRKDWVFLPRLTFHRAKVSVKTQFLASQIADRINWVFLLRLSTPMAKVSVKTQFLASQIADRKNWVFYNA